MGFFSPQPRWFILNVLGCHITTMWYFSSSRVLKIAHPLIHLHCNAWLLCIREVFIPAYVFFLPFCAAIIQFCFIRSEQNGKGTPAIKLPQYIITAKALRNCHFKQVNEYRHERKCSAQLFYFDQCNVITYTNLPLYFLDQQRQRPNCVSSCCYCKVPFKSY